MRTLEIYISPESNYWSYGKKAPGPAPTHVLSQVECHAGKGLVGDRFYNFKEDYRGQVTLISKEFLDDLKKAMGVDFEYQTLRRNVLVEEGNPLDLVGRRFKIGDVELEGTEDCTPCAFWDKAIKPGAFQWLLERNAGGLRARVLKGGVLKSNQLIEVLAPEVS